jgi:hypothetical protein
MQLQGQRLDSFNHLLDVDLPPVGPYSLSGEFGVNTLGYTLSNLLLKGGSSKLLGNLTLTTTSKPPKLDVQLVSERLQIDDFNPQGWSAKDDQIKEQNPTENIMPEITKANGNHVRKVLSPEVFNSLSANVDIQIYQVLSGEDRLGNGTMLLTLTQGRLYLQSLQIDVPGGSVKLKAQLYPTAQYVEVGLQALVDTFDYGIFARRIDR